MRAQRLLLPSFGEGIVCKISAPCSTAVGRRVQIRGNGGRLRENPILLARSAMRWMPASRAGRSSGTTLLSPLSRPAARQRLFNRRPASSAPADAGSPYSPPLRLHVSAATLSMPIILLKRHMYDLLRLASKTRRESRQRRRPERHAPWQHSIADRSVTPPEFSQERQPLPSPECSSGAQRPRGT